MKKQQLPPPVEQRVNTRYRRNRKSRIIGFILALLGLHYVYLGRWGTFLIFLLTAGGIGIWWIVTWFLCWPEVNLYNQNLYDDIVDKELTNYNLGRLADQE